jgi:hypothetical protein
VAINESTIAAGLQPLVTIYKDGNTTRPASYQHGYTPRYEQVEPLAIPSVGVDGAAVVLGGMLNRKDASSGYSAYVARFGVKASRAGTALLIDRLWESSGLLGNSTSAQAISPASLPARDDNGSSDGVGVRAAIEIHGLMTTAQPNVTLTYTNSSGNTGKTGAVSASIQPLVGSWEFFSMESGDNGVRGPTSLIQSASRGIPTYGLVLFRLLAVIPCRVPFVEHAIDIWTGPIAKLHPGTSPDVVWMPDTIDTVQYAISYQETHIQD